MDFVRSHYLRSNEASSLSIDFDGRLSPLARCHWLKPFGLLHGPVLQARYGLIDCGLKANKVDKEM